MNAGLCTNDAYIRAAKPQILASFPVPSVLKSR